MYDNELSHSMVHYLLTIHKLKESRGFARVTDIAKELNLTKGSVSTAINNLKKKDLVEEEKDCKFLILTLKGHEKVHRILSARTLLFHFLKDFLKVSENTAVKDACLMEHLMSAETQEKFFNFMKDSMDSSNVELDSTLDLCEFGDISEFVLKQKDEELL